jgi:cell wall-associated NlpC family hydrolase
LASIHKQETDFSRNPTVRAGTNPWGAAGPMQFLRTTWISHDKAFKSIASARPKSYPLNRKTLPSCAGVPAELGCIYDDFDAIAGAAHKLAADGADMSLTSAGTRRAVCAYIGSCGEVDKCTGSVNQYCQVIPRARKWELEAGPVDSAPGQGAEGAVRWALSQDGVEESPLGSNCGGPINGWQRRTGTPCGTAWCGVFVHESFLRAGIDLPNWIASVPTTWSNARAGHGGLKAVSKNQIKRGDIVIFQWDTGSVDHMGLATQDWPGTGRLATIEGNTSHGVHRRNERESTIVGGVRVIEGAK